MRGPERAGFSSNLLMSDWISDKIDDSGPGSLQLAISILLSDFKSDALG
jgi:hypothetical protein